MAGTHRSHSGSLLAWSSDHMLQDLDTAVLARAADLFVASETADRNPADGAADGFLHALGYRENVGGDPEREAHRGALLKAATSFDRVFLLSARHAPGLVLMGAVVRPDPTAGHAPGSVTGSGLDLKSAFESCIGEGIEFLSQFEQDGDLAGSGVEEPLVDVFPEADGVPDWSGGDRVRGIDLATDTEVSLPFDRCIRSLRRSGAASPPFMLGTGCGAGDTLDAAALHGLYELIERDAAALWWWGRRRGRPLAAEEPGVRSALLYLATLRGERLGRVTWFLDITTDVGVPVMASISVDRDGSHVACGTACRASVAAALQSAIREMCQMEMAYDVVRAKEAQSGAEALNAVDLRHKERAAVLSADGCEHLHPAGVPARYMPVADDDAGPELTLPRIVQRLGTIGANVYRVDLSRERFGVPVARMIVPQLQLYPSKVVSPRLKRCFDESGIDDPLFPLH
ncbi:MAG: YcaO-like family protein [Nisaea sp.]|uniref:YcaO-like family protein n=1 Tax=Nisaea sp. TaxID=2024842 RepID=UPI001B157CC5|nr:YcaO-like family protein [Nisaea sp.]MBO6561301.1 YcaO-like family protein [Nisaea sp.]